MSKLICFLLSLSAVMTLSGCGWDEDSGWSSQAAWADDGQEAALVFEYFESKNRTTHIARRNFESEVHLSGIPGISNRPRRQIDGRQPGQVRHLYFMRSQGYVIVGRIETNAAPAQGRNQFANYVFEKIDLQGNSTPLGSLQAQSMISCDAEGNSATSTGDPLLVVPSPDGLVLAKVESTVTCNGRDSTLNFLNADTLEVIGGPYEMWSRDNALGLDAFAWLPNGEFAIAAPGFGGVDGESYTVDGQTRSLAGFEFDCFYPATSSSDINTSGQEIHYEAGDRQTIMINETDQPGFGCPSL